MKILILKNIVSSLQYIEWKSKSNPIFIFLNTFPKQCLHDNYYDELKWMKGNGV